MEQIRQRVIYGVRQSRTFRVVATRFLNEATKATIREDARNLKYLDPIIGDLPLEGVHMGSLQPFIEKRRKQGVENRTINYGLQTVRHILNLAASEWFDEQVRPRLDRAPKIKLLKEYDRKPPYPLSWEEQTRLFNALPSYLAKLALFKVNTGCRDQDVCNLRWEWEVPVPEMDTSVFIIPAEQVKNRQDRVVVLNRIARAVVQEMRGVHPVYVFSYRGKPLRAMLTSAWKRARVRVRLPDVRVHDLKHTFGRRLRAAGVSFEDRRDLFGHKSGRVTTHYSMPELENLIEAANRVCQPGGHKMATLVVLKRKTAELVVTNSAVS
jgi:integrase